MFQFFGSQFLAIKSVLSGKKASCSETNGGEETKPKGVKRMPVLAYLKMVLFILLSVYIGFFWYLTYHIREEKYAIGQTPLIFDNGSDSIATSFGVDVHVFYDYSGLAYIGEDTTFNKKRWIYAEDENWADTVDALPGIQLVRTDTIHGKIDKLPRIGSSHIDRLAELFGDTLDIASSHPELLNCFYKTYIECSQWNRFLPTIHLDSGVRPKLFPQGSNSTSRYANRLHLETTAASPEQSSTLNIDFYEPADTVFYSRNGRVNKAPWKRLSLFSDFDLSRVTERIDFKADPYQLLKDNVITDEDAFGIYTLAGRLHSVHFYFGTATIIEGGNVMPDSTEDGGFWITAPTKLRQIERDGLVLNLKFPQMENMQNARMYLITTMLTATVAYATSLVYRELRKLSRKVRIWLTLGLLVTMIIAWILTIWH